VDELSFTPYNKDVVVAADLAGQIAGAQLWGYTIRWAGQEGGTMRVAQPSILVDPWNPVAGSNWIYDSMPIRAVQDYGVVLNPYTGLAMPKRIEKAELVVEEGLPVGASSDWISLSFAPSIEVPGDAWVDWDAVNQKWITASEKFTSTQTALTKSTVYYPADLFDTITWHDGSPLTVGDFMMSMIVPFDRAKPESAIYDESAASSLEAFLAHFKGFKIISTDPLVIETYDDLWYLDAENAVSTWWPQYGYGDGAWHNIAVGVRAESANTLAFSADKAEANAVEWMSYIAGPSLAVLKTEMVSATAEAYVPFAPTMGEYVGADEVALRYENLASWYRNQGHFWLGTGPYFLNKAFPTEQSLTLSRYEAYPEPADKWSIFGGAKLATTEIDGPGQVKIGDAATFDVFVTFNDEPYPAAELESAKFLLYNAKGEFVATGPAEAAGDGQFTVTLPADVTSKLEAGSNKLEVAVISRLVSVPSFAAFEFVTAP
jgi:peptide/nickel transport system substrate-binding protein